MSVCVCMHARVHVYKNVSVCMYVGERVCVCACGSVFVQNV